MARKRLVGKATAILKSDIESLPFPEDEAELQLSFWEQVLAKDMLQYIARLPTPGSGREREYVASAAGEKPGGGVQRFKLGLHGARLAIAGMIGYVQAKAAADWFAEVNRWIDELAASADPLWSGDDRLKGFIIDSGARVSRCDSEHKRKSVNATPIRLAHL